MKFTCAPCATGQPEKCVKHIEFPRLGLVPCTTHVAWRARVAADAEAYLARHGLLPGPMTQAQMKEAAAAFNRPDPTEETA